MPRDALAVLAGELVAPAADLRAALLLGLVAPVGAVGVAVTDPGVVDAVVLVQALELGAGAGLGREPVVVRFALAGVAVLVVGAVVD